MKRWFWSVLVILLLATNGVDYQLSDPDEELPPMHEVNVQEV